jgi:hypothetical protein
MAIIYVIVNIIIQISIIIYFNNIINEKIKNNKNTINLINDDYNINSNDINTYRESYENKINTSYEKINIINDLLNYINSKLDTLNDRLFISLEKIDEINNFIYDVNNERLLISEIEDFIGENTFNGSIIKKIVDISNEIINVPSIIQDIDYIYTGLFGMSTIPTMTNTLHYDITDAINRINQSGMFSENKVILIDGINDYTGHLLNSIAIGSWAAYNSLTPDSIALGNNSLNAFDNNRLGSSRQISIGPYACYYHDAIRLDLNTNDLIAIGYGAAAVFQDECNINIGKLNGRSADQSPGSDSIVGKNIVIGEGAGAGLTYSLSSIIIGKAEEDSTLDGGGYNYLIRIGYLEYPNNRTAERSISIGKNSGFNENDSTPFVAIGVEAVSTNGSNPMQDPLAGDYLIAIGYRAGYINAPHYCIAIGNKTCYILGSLVTRLTDLKYRVISIGYNERDLDLRYQSDTILLGYDIHNINEKSLIINTSGTPFTEVNTSSGFYVKGPIRPGSASEVGLKLYYNTVTGEVFTVAPV